MKYGLYFTSLIVLLLIPITAVGSYLSYTQARARVEELNQITPLHKTDLERVVRLSLNLDEVEEDADTDSAADAPPLTTASGERPTPIPTQGAADPVATADVDASTDPTAEADQVATALETPEPVTSIDPRRVTVLLMGIDQREGEEGRFRTDTMILLSLDPIGKTGAILSIPRDLWVDIPGSSQAGRINTANYLGDDPALNYPGGGPALAMLTVERLIGQPIDHYALVNFTAFTAVIETVGAIEICVEERIDDPKYPDGSYGYMPIVIEAGCQEMDGERLLQYARTRATEDGDFDRSRRQQEVILAVREKVLSTGGLGALIADAPTIWASVNQNISTDLTLDQLIELALAAAELNDIRTGTISTGEVLQGTSPAGEEILIPIQTDIFALVADLFRPPNRPAAAADEVVIPDPNNVPLQVREEAAIIAVLNGTAVQGRAARLRDYIGTYNLDVGFIGNAPDAPNVTETRIVYYGDHAASGEYLSYVLALINGNNRPIVERGEGTPPSDGDVFVLLGTDLVMPQPEGD